MKSQIDLLFENLRKTEGRAFMGRVPLTPVTSYEAGAEPAAPDEPPAMRRYRWDVHIGVRDIAPVHASEAQLQAMRSQALRAIATALFGETHSALLMFRVELRDRIVEPGDPILTTLNEILESIDPARAIR